MRRPGSLVVACLLTMLLAAYAAFAAYGGSPHRLRAVGCSTAVAGARPMMSADPTFLQLGGEPFGVVTTRGYAFVANLRGFLDVLADHNSAPRLIHKLSLGGEPLGAALTPDGRYLLMADGGDGAYVVDVARAEAGMKDALLGTLSAGKSGRLSGGAIEVAVSGDGRYAFVSLEGSDRIAVYRLSAAIADRFRASWYVGAIATGLSPVGLAVSPDGRWLYSTSEIDAPAHLGGSGGVGSLSVIDVTTAEHDPAKAVVATTRAGCDPVRVTVSSNGQDVWVTARGSDELIAFSSSKLIGDATRSELTQVRVGEAPVGLALVDHDRLVIVADSNRFNAAGRDSALTVVSTAAALEHRPAVIGTIRAGLFPREMALEPAGSVLLVGNFGSGTLEAAHIAARAQETRGRSAKPIADD